MPKLISVKSGLNNIESGGKKVLTEKGFYDFNFKEACRFATGISDDLTTGYTYNAVGTITKDAVGVVTIDGGTIALSDRILVKNQTAGLQNGIYKVTTLGSGSAALVLTRADDCNSDSEVTSGLFVHVQEGSANADNNFALKFCCIIESSICVPKLLGSKAIETPVPKTPVEE